MFLFDFETISYNPIDKIEPLLYGKSESSFISIWPIAGTIGAGILAGATIASKSSSDSSNAGQSLDDSKENNKLPQIRDVVVAANEDGSATVKGKTEPGSSVTLKDPNGVDVPVTVNPDGTFTATVPAPAKDGDYTVTATDVNGKVGTGNGTLVDDKAPQVKDVVVTANEDGSATVSGKTEPGASVTLKGPNDVNVPVTVNPDGTFTATVPAPAKNGDYTVSVTDVNGQKSEATEKLIDKTDPQLDDLKIVINEDGSATLSGQTEPGATITITDSSGNDIAAEDITLNEDGSFSAHLDQPLADDYTVTVEDVNGNQTETEVAVPDLSDTVAPEVKNVVIIAQEDGSATLTAKTEAGAVITIKDPSGQVILSGAQVTVDAAGNITATLLAPAKNGNYIVEAKDAAGNVGVGAGTLIDAIAPKVSISSDSETVEEGANVTITFSFTEIVTSFSKDSLLVKGGLLSDLATSDNKTWTATFTQFGTNAPSISVLDDSYTDLAGNKGKGDTLDASNGLIVNRPDELLYIYDNEINSNQTTPLVFDKASSENTLVVSGYTNDAWPTFIGTGTYELPLTVKLLNTNGDSLGEYSVPVSKEGFWTLDLASLGPLVKLPEGEISVQINGKLQTKLIVDTSAPEIEMNLPEGNLDSVEDVVYSKKNVIDLAVSEPDLSWSYSLDSGKTWTVGTGDPDKISLKDGTYDVGSIIVKIEDKAGNITEKSNETKLVIDTAAPQKMSAQLSDTGSSDHDSYTKNAQFTLKGVESDAQQYYSLDGENWIPVINNSFTLVLADGSYSNVLIKQVDKAGNESISQIPQFTLDTQIAHPNLELSDTTILATGQVYTNNPIVKISNIEAGAKIYYRLKGTEEWTEILSEAGQYSIKLADDHYSVENLQFKHVDKAGNEVITSTPVDDASPSFNEFNIDTKTEVSISNIVATGDVNEVNLIGQLTNKNTLTVSGKAEANATVEILIDGQKISTDHEIKVDETGNWSINLTLDDGQHRIEVKAIDGLKNQAVSDYQMITVDTVTQVPTINAVSKDDKINSAEYLGGFEVSGTAEAGSIVHLSWYNPKSVSGGVELGNLTPHVTAVFKSSRDLEVTSLIDTKGNVTINIVDADNNPIADFPQSLSQETTIFTLPKDFKGPLTITVTNSFKFPVPTEYNNSLEINNKPYEYTVVADSNGNWDVSSKDLILIDDQGQSHTLDTLPTRDNTIGYIVVSATDAANNTKVSESKAVTIVKGSSAIIHSISEDDFISLADKVNTAGLTITGDFAEKAGLSGKNAYLYIKNGKDEYIKISADGKDDYIQIPMSGSDTKITWSTVISQSVINGLSDGQYTVELWDNTWAAGVNTLYASRPITVDYKVPDKLEVNVYHNFNDEGLEIIPFEKIDPKKGNDNLQNDFFTQDVTPKLQGIGSDEGNLITITWSDKDGKIIGTHTTVVKEKTNVLEEKTLEWSYDFIEPLKDGQYSVSVIETDIAGNASEPQIIDLIIDTTPPVVEVVSIANDIIAESEIAKISLDEITDGVQVKLNITEPNIEKVTVKLGEYEATVVKINDEWIAQFTPEQLANLQDNTSYIIKVSVQDHAGHIVNKAIEVKTEFGLSLVFNEADYDGQPIVQPTDLNVDEVKLLTPTTTFTVKGQEVEWQLLKEGTIDILVAKIGEQVVLRVEPSRTKEGDYDLEGTYVVSLATGIDHLDSDIATIQIPVSIDTDSGMKSSQLTLVINDSQPNVVTKQDRAEALVEDPRYDLETDTIILDKAGSYESKLVESFGMDGGYIQSVTIEGNTYIYKPDADQNEVKVQQYGNSESIYAYSFDESANLLTVTTIHGDSILVNMQTGLYEVIASGIKTEPAIASKPEASLGNTGGLLGTANVNVAGIIDLSSSQVFTVADANNNISKVMIQNAALINLDIGGHYSYSEQLAKEFGFKVEIIHSVIVTPARITITALDGSTMDIDKLNEFLGTVAIANGLGQVLDVKVLAGQTIEATDSSGLKGSDTSVNLADVGVLKLGALAQLAASGIIQHGDKDGVVFNDYLIGDKSTKGLLDDRLYGYAGNDRIDGRLGNDILRGGAGNDELEGGLGRDILIGGTGNDVLRGDSSQTSETERSTDTFKWELNDQAKEPGQSGITTDIILDFDKSSLREGGDILHLAGLLKGEGRLGMSVGNLMNYLHFIFKDGNTEIHISTDGNYIGGYSSAVANVTDQIIVLNNVDLVTGAKGDQEIIAELISQGKLVVDNATIENTNLNQDNIINISAEVVDGDGDVVSLEDEIKIDTSKVQSTNFNPNNVAPETSVSMGGLLGLINLDTLGLINLSDQYLTAYDTDNNLQSVEVKYLPVITVSVTPMEFDASETLAEELGLKFTIKNDDGVLGLIAPSSRLIITSINGGPIDNLAVNELLASVHLQAQKGTLTADVLSLDIINSITITATDTQGASTTSDMAELLGLNLLNIDKFNSAASNIIEGTSSDDNTLTGTNHSDRIYGLAGSDTIQAGDGDDLIRGGVGNDKLYGESGDDLLFGDEGDDILYGGEGIDILVGGTGSDTVVFEVLDEADNTGGNSYDIWTDFTLGNKDSVADADFINVHDLLDGKQTINNIKNYLSIEDKFDSEGKKNGVVLKVDRDGKNLDDEGKVSKDKFEDSDLLVLQNTDTTLDQLLANGQIIF